MSIMLDRYFGLPHLLGRRMENSYNTYSISQTYYSKKLQLF